MQTTVLLTENEIKEAIEAYLVEKGYVIKGRPELSHACSFSNSPDPRERAWFSAKTEVEKR